MTNTNKQGPQIEAFVRSYRGIKIKDSIGLNNISLVTTRKFKIGPYNSVEVIDDGVEDYCELVQSNKDKCGISYICQLAYSQGVGPDTLPFVGKQDGVVDLSNMPESLAEAEKINLDAEKSNKQLEAMASKLGMSKDDLVSQFISGTLASTLESKNIENTEVNVNEK